MIEIIKLEEDIANAGSTEKIDLRLDLAYQIRTTVASKSTEHAMIAYTESCAINDTKRELRALYLICTAGQYNKDFTEFNKWIDLLIKRSIELNDNPALGRAYILQYRQSMSSGNLKDAAEYLIKALEFFDTKQHASEIVSCYLGLGNIHMKLKNINKGVDYYKKALPYARETNEQAYLMVLQNIGSAHVMKKEYREAWEVYHQVLDSLSDSDVETRRIVLDNLGHVCQHIGELSEALEYFQEAIDLGEKYDCRYNVIKPLCKIASIHQDLKNFQEALAYLQKAEQLTDTSGCLSEKIEVLYAMIKYFKIRQDLANLVLYHEKLLTATEKLNESAMLERIKEFEEQHHINRYKDQIIDLQQKIKLLSDQNAELKATIEKLKDEIIHFVQ
ncbi:MAG: tetratricopeptide repeat protein [Candidatus Cloacimonetes bacterium]|nr:tetratricopeptide repeat protein [Candidatus Cloacimonadota bacterium]